MKEVDHTIQSAVEYIKYSLKNIYPDKEIDQFVYLILGHLAGYTRIDLHINKGKPVTRDNMAKIYVFTERLKRHRPIQYILGETEFYGLTFRVNDHVMIPRQETEELVDRVVKDCAGTGPCILDVGTGSGCIAVCLARNLPGAVIDACDISENALEVASGNAKLNNVGISFSLLDFLSAREEHFSQRYDILISNPPYVREKEKADMQPNVLNYEPEEALFVPDNNPLLWYGKIAYIGKQILKKPGVVYVEINESFGKEVKDIFQDEGYMQVRVIRDIHGKDRFVKGAWKSGS